MGSEYSSLSVNALSLNCTFCVPTRSFPPPESISKFNFTFNPIKNAFPDFALSKIQTMNQYVVPSTTSVMAINSGKLDAVETDQEETIGKLILDPHGIDQKLLQKMIYDGLVWSSLHGLIVGSKSVQQSGTVPGMGMIHAPFSLLPMPFPESYWRQACELAPIFNELFDRVSLDAKFIHDSLSRTKKVDAFTSRLLDIHSRMIELNKKEDIRMGLHRSDFMLDAQTRSLLQIEFNTVASSFPGVAPLVPELHRNLLNHYGSQFALDSKMVPQNTSNVQFAEAMAKAWHEFGNPRAIVLFVVQPEERNMYDQHWLSSMLRERYGVTAIRKTMGEIDTEGELSSDGTLVINGEAVGLVYFRAGYTPIDYPSDSEWMARLLIEQSSAIKCPSIAYHLAGTKKIQQELAKPNILERFLDNKDDIAKVRKCFAGLWSLDDSAIVDDAIERPEMYVMKPQREGGGNNIYGNDVRENLLRLRKEGSKENAAYILMQRIFPSVYPVCLIREGICHKDHAISELGIYGAYLRNKEKVIMNEQCGYLMRTKVSSSDEGGVAAGFAVLDSLYLT